ncbi:MAG: AAA family ATPase [Candidatus Woesearchaeota archaeon]
MGLFVDVLKEGESVFKQEEALDYDYIPKVLPFRENQQHALAACIKPLLQGRNGRNVFVYGAPGIGKTAATKWVLQDLEQDTDAVHALYINCWQKNTTFKIFEAICHQLGYKFTQNKHSEELLGVIKNYTLKRPAVFVFDEIDKAEDLDFLYALLNDIYKKSIVLITNYRDWLNDVEDRIKSRLVPEILEFAAYDSEQTKEILKQRTSYAFVPGVWQADAFTMLADKAGEMRDVRKGLYLLREAGLAAEEKASRKITVEHAQKAIDKLSEFIKKDKEDLDNDLQLVLDVVKAQSGSRIGDLFKAYAEKGGPSAYKTFQRKVEKLSKAGLVETEKITGGKEGNTTIVKFAAKDKKLDEF